MNTAEQFEKIDLNDIANISEDEFKKQISAWIDERGVSRVLQSKLRADLFEQFNRTNLGRKMAVQHQQSQRIVLSPLILVLNTLVAEFLYAENCHFSLSVFATEVPYKNTLPNFEATPSKQLFRFTATELNDIFEATGVSKANEEIIRKFYLSQRAVEQSDALNRSLLYCIFKSIVSCQPESGRCQRSKKDLKAVKPKLSKLNATVAATSSSQKSSNEDGPKKSPKCPAYCSSTQMKHKKFEISSRYFKYLNRYLDILSERVREMSQTLAQKQVNLSKDKKASAATSSALESCVKRDLEKIIENLNFLTKSKEKSKRFQDIVNSIERLSISLEKCGGNLEGLLMATNANASQKATIDAGSKENEMKTSIDAARDRFKHMDYGAWLQELKTSEYGKRFIDRLEMSLQKTMEKERTNLEKLYEDKINNYRMLIKLHYKQKYDKNGKDGDSGTPRSKISPFDDDPAAVSMEKPSSNALKNRLHEKEIYVDQIVETAKMRLQQLENESEKLDESFQAYLKRQRTAKHQVNQDVSKIWENYNLGKAALAQHNPVTDQVNVFNNSTKLIDTKTAENPVNNIIYTSAFHDEIDIHEALKDLTKVNEFESPFKKLSSKVLFPKKQVMRVNVQTTVHAAKISEKTTQTVENSLIDANVNKSDAKVDAHANTETARQLSPLPESSDANSVEIALGIKVNESNRADKINEHPEQNDIFLLTSRFTEVKEMQNKGNAATMIEGSIVDKNNTRKFDPDKDFEGLKNEEVQQTPYNASHFNGLKDMMKYLDNDADSTTSSQSIIVDHDLSSSTPKVMVNGKSDMNITNEDKVAKTSLTFIAAKSSSSTESDVEEFQQISTGPTRELQSPEDFWN